MDRNEGLLAEYKAGNREARDTLCNENMGLVRSIVKRFGDAKAENEDLMQIGAIGLLKAIDKFDSSFGVKFSTYAVPMIIGEIRRFLRDDGIIKVSRTLKSQAYLGYRAREELYQELGREPTIFEISEKSGIPHIELAAAFDATAMPDSINRKAYEDSDEEIADLVSTSRDEERTINKITVKNILDKLSKREREILILRYFRGKTQAEIAPIVGVSQVQVSRIEKKVIERIRKECAI